MDCVEWFDLEEVYQACQPPREEKFCVPMGGLEIVRRHVNSQENESSGLAIGMCLGTIESNKISRYEEAVKTGVLSWDAEDIKKD